MLLFSHPNLRAYASLKPYLANYRHAALEKAGTPNQLLTIPGGRHGNFTPEERTRIYVTRT